MFVPGIVASVNISTAELAFDSGTYIVDWEEANLVDHSPEGFFSEGSGITQGYTQEVSQFVVSQLKTYGTNNGTYYGFIGPTSSYAFNSSRTYKIDFYIPSTAVNPEASVWWRRESISTDTITLDLVQYAVGEVVGGTVDTTYNIVVDDSNNIQDQFFTQFTQSVVAGRWYQLTGTYFYRTTNPNWPSDFRQPNGPGESLHMDDVAISWSGDEALLLHADNANTDSGVNTYSMQSSGGLAYTASSKFGSHAFDFSGGNDFVRTLDDTQAGINANGNDFTIECWVQFTSLSQVRRRLVWRNTSATVGVVWGITYENTFGSNTLDASWAINSTSSIGPSGTPSFSTGVWYHIALTREVKSPVADSILRLFVDGILLSSTQNANAALDYNPTTGGSSNGIIWIGNDNQGSVSPFDGYIDEVRILNGRCDYKKDFVPRHAPW